MRAPDSDPSHIAADVLERLRERAPRVHCITNAVAQAYTANFLLAAGAVPSMTIAPKEIGSFAQRADALLVNLGTFDDERQKATLTAVSVMNKAKKPWVLDPVFIDRSRPRTEFAKKLVAKRPAAVRLNQAEFLALTGGETRPDDTTLARTAAGMQTVIGLTGEIDVVCDGPRMAEIANGHPLMARVTAMGCANSALVAACLAVEPDAWRATVAAFVMVGVAGELAAERARGPGTFAIEIVDAIYGLTRDALHARARVTE